MSKWVEVVVPADLEAVEPICELLNRHVRGGVAIELSAVINPDDGTPLPQLSERVLVKGYLAGVRGWKKRLRHIEMSVSLLGQVRDVGSVQWRVIDEEDWASTWKQHYHPLLIGHRVVVKPSWEEYEPEPWQVVIELDPGMAFGTGLHPTTQLCLRQLELQVKSGMRVLDVGTGSGILAIAAARLGAASVLALDTDEVAVAAARRNVAMNRLQSLVKVVHGSLETASRESAAVGDSSGVGECEDNNLRTFDVVVANIVASVICQLAPGLARLVSRDGALIVGGIIQDKVDMVVQALKRYGVETEETEQMGDWVTLVGRRRV